MMSLVSGTKLGPYEILAPLGAGGMGVYRARDTRLERTVAIKILAAQVSNAGFRDNFGTIKRAEILLVSLQATPDKAVTFFSFILREHALTEIATLLRELNEHLRRSRS